MAATWAVNIQVIDRPWSEAREREFLSALPIGE